MRIDLHTHSSVSDGTESPAELLATARAAGLDVVALTDHDTTAGWARGGGGPAARADRRPRHGAVLPLVPRRPAADQRPPAGLPVRPAAPRLRRRAGAAAERAARARRADRRGPGRRRVPGRLGSRSSSGPTAASSAARTSRGPWWRPAPPSRSTTPSRPCCTTGAPTTSRRSTPTSGRASRWSGRPVGCRCSPTGWPPRAAASSATTRSRRWSRPGCSASRSTTPTTPPTSARTCAGWRPTWG